MKRLTRLGRAFFATAMAAFGLQYLIHALVAAVPPLGPPWSPAHLFWGYVSAIILVAAAAGIATGTLARCSAIALAILLFVRVLLAYVPRLVANIHDPGPWTSGSELLALCGAALVLAGVHEIGTNPVCRASPGVRSPTFPVCPLHRNPGAGVDSGPPVLGIFHRGGICRCSAFYRHSESGSSVGNFVGTHVFSVGAHPPSAQSGCGATQRK